MPDTRSDRLHTALDDESLKKRFLSEYRELFAKVESHLPGVPEGEPRRRCTQQVLSHLLFLHFLQHGHRPTLAESSKHLSALFPAALAGQEDFPGGDRFHIPRAISGLARDLFSRYPFSLTESTPWDIEVAIDPEMLGKVFEESVARRQERGSYYTPRRLVSYMCREALKHHLARAEKDEAAVARLVDEGDPASLSDPEAVLKALKAVKVCDPACGSGAYLVGMMQELFRLRELLFAASGMDAVPALRRKGQILHRNLYGVDLDPLAVTIARQRLWLSLIADLEGPSSPLSGIDFKIEQGDSLSDQGLFREGAFDIVVANPPYGIAGRDLHAALVSHCDSYPRFMGLACRLVGRRGVCAYLVPTSWETGERFTGFRRWLFHNTQVLSVVNLPYDVFEAPFVDTCVILFAPHASTAAAGSLKVLTMHKRQAQELETIAARLQDLPYAAVAADPRLRLVLRPEAAAVFQCVAENPRLSSAACLKRGIEAYQYTILPSPLSPSSLPFFAGKVQRYRAAATGSTAFVEVSGREAAWHRGERLVLRRLVSRNNRLTAARLTDDRVVKKDLYILKGAPGCGLSLSCLLGILSSSLLSYLYLARSASATKDDFRQVTLQGLRDLPLPPCWADQEAVCDLVEQIESAVTRGEAHDSLDAALDGLVYGMYGIPEILQEEIGVFLAARG